jgi:hypothetical protein
MEALRSLLDGLTAIFAFGAALAWFRAANSPVAVRVKWPGGDAYSASAFSAEDAVRIRRMETGPAWNRRAALLAGMSALSSSAAWIVGFLAH